MYSILNTKQINSSNKSGKIYKRYTKDRNRFLSKLGTLLENTNYIYTSRKFNTYFRNLLLPSQKKDF